MLELGHHDARRPRRQQILHDSRAPRAPPRLHAGLQFDLAHRVEGMFLPPAPARGVVREGQGGDVGEVELRDVDVFLEGREGFGEEVVQGGGEGGGDLGLDEHVLLEGAAVRLAGAGGLVGRLDAGFQLREEALELGDRDEGFLEDGAELLVGESEGCLRLLALAGLHEGFQGVAVVFEEIAG